MLVLCAAIGVVTAGCGFTTAEISGNDDAWSDAASFHKAERFFPQGKRLYWLGPTESKFHLVEAFRPGTASDPGVELAYVFEDQVLSLQTYRGAARPARGKLDFTRRTVVVATVETATGQLVVFAFRRGFPRPTPAVLERLTHALRAVASADIDRLPADWSEIGQTRP
jgi:hypothetical protein